MRATEDWIRSFRQGYEAFLRGDPQFVSDFLDATVVYHLPGNHLGGGELRGVAAILQRGGLATLACDSPPRTAVLEAVALPPFVVTVERFSASRGRRRLDQTVCVVWRFHDDRCVEIFSHFEDQAICDAFWQDVTF